VKVWRLGPSAANGQALGGRWSGRRKGPIEEEHTPEDDLVLSDQAVLEVSNLNIFPYFRKWQLFPVLQFPAPRLTIEISLPPWNLRRCIQEKQ
jgi:hypothetical protein